MPKNSKKERKFKKMILVNLFVFLIIPATLMCVVYGINKLFNSRPLTQYFNLENA